MRSVLFIIFILISSRLDAQLQRKDSKGNLEIVNADGLVLEYHLLDWNGHYRQGNALARIVYEYDSNGYRTSERYYKKNSRPYQYNNGVASKRLSGIRYGILMIVVNYDSSSNRTIDRTIGSSLVAYQYDSSRNVTSITHFDIDSVRCNNNDGFSRTAFLKRDQIVEYRYDQSDAPVAVINKETKYYMGLQLFHKSIPKWLRSAKQNNRTNGVTYKSLQYDLLISNQSFYGFAKLKLLLNHGQVQAIETIEVVNMPERNLKKLLGALRKAYFISLSNSSLEHAVGNMKIDFQKK
jgi:YD repeat-containing protein